MNVCVHFILVFLKAKCNINITQRKWHHRHVSVQGIISQKVEVAFLGNVINKKRKT